MALLRDDCDVKRVIFTSRRRGAYAAYSDANASSTAAKAIATASSAAFVVFLGS